MLKYHEILQILINHLEKMSLDYLLSVTKCRIVCLQTHHNTRISLSCLSSFSKDFFISIRCSTMYIDGLEQDCRSSIANGMEFLQSCPKPQIHCSTLMYFLCSGTESNIWLFIPHVATKLRNTAITLHWLMHEQLTHWPLGNLTSLKLVNFKLISTIIIWSIFCEIAIRWMPQYLTDH